MENKAEKLLHKIYIKDYTNNLEKILEKKDFSIDTKNLLLSMFYKIENAYKDYEKTKVQVSEQSEFLEKLTKIINEDCVDIIVTNYELGKNEKQDFILEEEGKIVALGNELILLKSILAIDQKDICVTEEEKIFKESVSYFLNSGSIMDQAEVIRDFNGWSWDISVKDIENIEINLVFQNLLYLLGHNFVYEWINNTSVLADYIMLCFERLKENFGEKRANRITDIIYKFAIETISGKDKEQEKFWKDRKQKIKIEYEEINNKTQYLEKITKEKKKVTDEIKKIDKIINNKELLEKEYENRNSKLEIQDKIFSVKQLYYLLEIERKEYFDKIKMFNKLIDPKGYVERKDEINKKYDFLNTLDLDKAKDRKKVLLELCSLFLECFKIKIAKATTKQEIVQYIYELRYYRFLRLDKENFLKDIKELEENFEETMQLLLNKAKELKAIDEVTEDKNINYQIISKIFDSKMIDLNHMIIEIKILDGKLFVEYYDTNILETTIEVESNKTIKLNKRTKLLT